MGDDNTNQKKRKSAWKTSYSNVTAAKAQERLGFRFQSLKGIPVATMLGGVDHILESNDTKDEVYKEITRYLRVEGFPTEADPEFKESNINHLVYATISPILDDFIRMTGRKNLQLRSEKEIVSTDGETGGTEEFVMDLISVTEENFVLIVEAKRSSIGKAMKQCLLAMKDARDSNGGEGKMYGFVTTGESWQMVEYDGKLFRKTETMVVLFDSMNENKERWMKDYSALVDCMNMALYNGGIVRKDVVVV
jgi:hypothetical protein